MRTTLFTSVALAALGVLPATAQNGADVDMSVRVQGLGRPLTLADAVPNKDGFKRAVVLRGLDKITARPTNIFAPVGVPVRFATLTITARWCYSTPQSEPPETTAFIDVVDHRPDKPERKIFSGWMLASSPSLNGLQHPLYDVWVISCKTNQPGQVAPVVASTATVKATSPDATAGESPTQLPEGAGQ